MTDGYTKRTTAAADSSVDEEFEFCRRNDASRLKEVQWSFASVIVSLFKNLRDVRFTLKKLDISTNVHY